MNDARFFTAYLQPYRTQVLGVKLLPFSLGHNILLHAIESPFLTGEEVGFADLASAVFLCGQKFEDAKVWFEDGPALQKFMRKWQKQCGVFDFQEKENIFRNYLSDAMSAPTFRTPASNAAPMSCPDPQIVKVTLLNKLNFREGELMDRPWNLCVADFLTLKALEGAIIFVDPEEVEDYKKIASMTPEQLEAACKAQKEANGTA